MLLMPLYCPLYCPIHDPQQSTAPAVNCPSTQLLQTGLTQFFLTQKHRHSSPTPCPISVDLLLVITPAAHHPCSPSLLVITSAHDPLHNLNTPLVPPLPALLATPCTITTFPQPCSSLLLVAPAPDPLLMAPPTQLLCIPFPTSLKLL